MALTDYKIDIYKNPVSSLPDNPGEAGMTAAQLKAAFDANATGEIKEAINAIIDDLDQLQGEIQGIRLNEDGQIQVTLDGENWSTPSDTKVDKVEGKELSANDYDDEEKEKNADSYSLRHSHDNKTVLDGITETKVSNWDSAYSKEHAHSNKTVLDGISAGNVDSWNNKVESSEVIKKTNTEEYAPSSKYHPATKGYVDTSIADAIIDAGGADMRKSVYDTESRNTDIFDYAELKVKVSALSDFAGLALLMGKDYKYGAEETAIGWIETVSKISDGSIFAHKTSTEDTVTGGWSIRTECLALNINETVVYSESSGNWEGVIVNA